MGQPPGGGVPISHNALQHFPECHGAATGGGGYPYPIMLCNISQNAMGQPPGGGVPWWGGGRDTLAGVYPGGGVLRSGTPPVGYPPSQVRMRGGTQLGQHREYLLHGGWYASCVHAGGLSCYFILIYTEWIQNVLLSKAVCRIILKCLTSVYACRGCT